MLFYSYGFLFVFLPLALAGFFAVARLSRHAAAAWLMICSMIFYGYWNPLFTLLLLASILFNWLVGRALVRSAGTARARRLLALGVVANLAVLAYFKYTNFFLGVLDDALGLQWRHVEILLPLGVSVFTFTQIAFLVDVHRGLAREYRLIHYALFVGYFPHLIAGPIIHHAQFMPQVDDPAIYRARLESFSLGLATFAIGMAKKVLLAGSFAEYADPIFDGVDRGLTPGFAVAWVGMLAFALQIYFDFSGYTDMAIGLSRMFGIRLPENFNSPYKSRNIIEFWRRWNMTLSRFLRDYLYIPLGGNRSGSVRRYINLAITMILGGLWHGANWTFVLWGLLHAGYLGVNHAFQELSARLRLPAIFLAKPLSVLLTFLAVLIAWVPFRATTLEGAGRMLAGLGSPGLTGDFAGMFHDYWLPEDGNAYRLGMVLLGLGIVWFAPNTRQIMERVHLVSPRVPGATLGALAFGIIVLAAIAASRTMGQFIYFNF